MPGFVVAACRLRLWSAILLALLGLGLTQARSAERDRVIAFLEITGFDVALDSIALSAEHAPGMLGMRASDFGPDWGRVTAEVFDKPRMRRNAVDILERTLSDEALLHASAFYASDLGQRLVVEENASHLHPDDDAKSREGEALVEAAGEGDGARLAALQRLSDAVGSTDQSVRAIHELQVRFIMAASDAGVLEGEIDEGALRAILAEEEGALRASLDASGLVTTAYTYRDFTIAELDAYTSALKEPLMQEVYELLNATQHEITVRRFEALALRMAGLGRGQEL